MWAMAQQQFENHVASSWDGKNDIRVCLPKKYRKGNDEKGSINADMKHGNAST